MDNKRSATQYYVCWVVDFYHAERNPQGLGNELITGSRSDASGRRIYRRLRLGGLLNFYTRAA